MGNLIARKRRNNAIDYLAEVLNALLALARHRLSTQFATIAPGMRS